MMVEVLKTNITDPTHARLLVELIHQTFPAWRANFDLQDCDRILRIVSAVPIDTPRLVAWLQTLGCQAEPLPDEVPVTWLPLRGEVQLLGRSLPHSN